MDVSIWRSLPAELVERVFLNVSDSKVVLPMLLLSRHFFHFFELNSLL